VLAGVDLDVFAGELVVLTGEDGCGTSTLLRALVDLGPAALLAQPPGDDWADSDVVRDLLTPAGRALLADLGAAHLPLEREMWMLSGGERQRVRLARVLAADPAPAVLLLDEPLGYLDGAGVRALLALLRARADAGAAVLVVAKGDDRAIAVADRVLELADGALTRVA
jgi:energy-coupling factor transporter ATP-binding protein EcfA2